ncbi:membrane transporter-like protein [Dinothrombium tinctorium]|uniref:Membrane transporter-like protein n=1 Tax=Dinothrombium tinctorium TaxID=1965070 RepID=A0A3S3RQL1_9ACAR|nr:membrane transporter-like protein [Dinothrombium tinctorium]RWS03271.1 membrane transporter-like protein [Dinothrombium tinctorium]RWS03272.1 membrane transporter-like protein [Dinothrombium tinctorium]RWS07899.1 membrane transporter-like protein [Dinothrombium tinctorium]
MNFILIAMNVFITTAVTAVLWILLNQIFSKNFSNAATLTSATGLTYNVSAVVGCLILPLILDKTKRYRPLIFSTYSIAFIFSLLFMTTLLFKLTYLIFPSVFVFGACLYGQRVMMYDLVIEVTYPFPEGTSIGLIVSLSYLFASCFIPLLSWLIDSFNILFAIIVIETLLLFGLFPLFFISIKLLRNEAEKTNDLANNEQQFDEIEI